LFESGLRQAQLRIAKAPIHPEYRATVPRRASSYLDVVTAQRTGLEAERLAIALHTRQLVAVIGLMLALGCGWTVPPEPPARPGFAPYVAE
jgi:hypothetical protein